jgi:prophage regulatory protein
MYEEEDGRGEVTELAGVRRMLSERQLRQLIPVSRSTLQRWVAQGKFPAPVQIGKRRTVWFADDVRQWQLRACDAA